MKNRVSFISLALMMAASAASMAQVNEVRERLEPGSITQVRVLGVSDVKYFYDTTSYIAVQWDGDVMNRPASYGTRVVNHEAIINDTTGKLKYELHLDTNLFHVTWAVASTATVTFPDGHRLGTENKSFRQVGDEFKSLIDELVYVFDSISLEKKGRDTLQLYAKRNKRKYSVRDRTNFDFHWGFNNWGDAWYNGLMKMEGPYNLRTSFSSYQLSENYAIVMTDHIKLSLGIGYESDVYKFTNNYVTMGTDGALTAQNQAGVDAVSGVSGSSLGDWSTRLVTRYVTMPVEFEYRDKGILKSFRLALGVIPGLSFSSSHTGMKYELEQRGRNFHEVQEGVSKFINPFKLDVRLTFKRKLFGMFIQVPTMPVFIDTDTKVYPIKIGFML